MPGPIPALRADGSVPNSRRIAQIQGREAVDQPLLGLEVLDAEDSWVVGHVMSFRTLSKERAIRVRRMRAFCAKRRNPAAQDLLELRTCSISRLTCCRSMN